MSHPKPPLKPIKIRKELLVAEAEVLRSQMGQDFDIIRQGITGWEGHAKSVASYAAIAATTLAGFSAFRRRYPRDLNRKRSVFSTLWAVARVALTLWGAWRSGKR